LPPKLERERATGEKKHTKIVFVLYCLGHFFGFLGSFSVFGMNFSKEHISRHVLLFPT
jgi:hypothetical protein